jgi:hypothetical protein
VDIEQPLNQIAERYRAQGYRVITRPGPDDLPPFAKDFKVEVLATRSDGGVLASAKGSPSEFQSDPNLSRYAEVIEKQPGWRYDVFVLGPDPQSIQPSRDAREPSDEAVTMSLDEAERMLQAGFVAQSLTAAWAALESAMRLNLRTQGSEAGWGTSPRTMLNELLASGVLSNSDFNALGSLLQLRNVLIHGFSAPPIQTSSVRFLVDIARRLLAETSPASRTA